MTIINGKNSGIMTHDKSTDNLLLGEIRVKKMSELEEIKEELLQSKRIYQVTKEENLRRLSSKIEPGFNRNGNLVIHNKITDTQDYIGVYTKTVIECQVLNSLLLFISLSGELDATNYNNITKQFVRLGIINCKRIENIWKSCSANIVNGVFSEINKKNVTSLDSLLIPDFDLFRLVLAEGIISYDVISEIPFVKVSSTEEVVFRGWNNKDREELAINNALLLNDKSIFSEYIRKRTK